MAVFITAEVLSKVVTSSVAASLSTSSDSLAVASPVDIGEFFGIALAAAFSRILCSSLILKDVGDYMTGEKGRKKKK